MKEDARKLSMNMAQTDLYLVEQKLAAFDQLQPEFERCFQFVQETHGQRRFPAFSIGNVVHYLHALWICECKDRLLSISHSFVRYEGSYCLNLLQNWQMGATSEVVAFLQRKLDGMPFAMLTKQIQQVRAVQPDNSALIERLEHGRRVLLNRVTNLLQAFETIFALAEPDLLQEVQEACSQYEHQPEQIKQQLAAMNGPLYASVPHQSLAQRNMLVMNKVGISAVAWPDDLPGKRSEKVAAPGEFSPAFAEQVIPYYRELNLPLHQVRVQI
jgi:hypothetical protein